MRHTPYTLKSCPTENSQNIEENNLRNTKGHEQLRKKKRRDGVVFFLNKRPSAISSCKPQANATTCWVYSATCVSRRRSCHILKTWKESIRHMSKRILRRSRAKLFCIVLVFQAATCMVCFDMLFLVVYLMAEESQEFIALVDSRAGQ